MTDFLGGPAARRVGVKHAVFTTNAVGLIALTAVLAFAEGARQKLFVADIHGILAALAAAVLLLGATLTLSVALKSGKAAIVAPIAMSYGIVTTILSMLSGEHVRGTQLLGIAICVIGVPMTGMASEVKTKPGTSRHSPVVSVTLAACAMLCFGASYWVQGRYAIKAIGTVGSLWINYAFATCVMGVGLICFNRQGTEPPAIRYPIVLAQASFSLLALATFSWGLTIGNTSTLSVLSTLSGAVTALLGFAFRGERLNRIQWLGVATVVVGAGVVRW